MTGSVGQKSAGVQANAVRIDRQWKAVPSPEPPSCGFPLVAATYSGIEKRAGSATRLSIVCPATVEIASCTVNGGIVTESDIGEAKWSPDDYRAFFDQAQEALLRGLPDLERRAETLLEKYRGIPTNIDLFEILGLHGAEDAHTEFLAWLLQPGANHGAGSRFLRGFLALIPDPQVTILTARSDLDATWVRTQWPLDEGTPDLMVLMETAPKRGLALIIEAKIHALLTNKGGQPQTERYVRSLKTPEQQRNAIIEPFRRTSECRIETVDVRFIFLRARPDQDPEPNLGQNDKRKKDEPSMWLTVNYASVERMVGEIAREIDMSQEARHAIQQFRTSLLVGALPENRSLNAVESLRHLWLNRKHVSKLTVATKIHELVTGLEDSDEN
jgi:hypothetical protein